MKIEQTPIDDITPYHRNPRKNDQAVEKVAESIDTYGWLQPIVVDGQGVIVVGHTRYAAARQLGVSTVPVIWARSLTEDQARAYRIMDNKAHDYTRWDREELRYELDELPDLNATGFTLKELDEILYPELATIGSGNNRHQARHRVIVECESRDDMLEIQSRLIKKGYTKCQTSYY